MLAAFIHLVIKAYMCIQADADRASQLNGCSGAKGPGEGGPECYEKEKGGASCVLPTGRCTSKSRTATV